MTSRRHPWPTDGVTKRELDRQIDRLDRRIDAIKEVLKLTREVVKENKELTLPKMQKQYSPKESD